MVCSDRNLIPSDLYCSSLYDESYDQPGLHDGSPEGGEKVYSLFDSGFPTSNTQALHLGYDGCFFCLHEPHHR